MVLLRPMHVLHLSNGSTLNRSTWLKETGGFAKEILSRRRVADGEMTLCEASASLASGKTTLVEGSARLAGTKTTLREVPAIWQRPPAPLREATARLADGRMTLREVSARLAIAKTTPIEATATRLPANLSAEMAIASTFPGSNRPHAHFLTL